MCGILLTSRGIENLPHIIELLKFRGPDQTNTVTVNGLNFVHTLLSMTAPPPPQPFVSEDGERVAFFNGEIYNFMILEIMTQMGNASSPYTNNMGTIL